MARRLHRIWRRTFDGAWVRNAIGSQLARLAFSSLVLILALQGCKPKDKVEPSQTARHPNPQLEAEAERLVQFTPPGDPGLRDAVTSHPAPNRRDWALEQLLVGYQQTGKTNALWDAKMEAAFEAYSDYSRVSTESWPQLEESVRAAVATGCDDPMLAYMRVRYLGDDLSAEQKASEFLHTTLAMAQSQYHPVFNFMSGLRSAGAIRDAKIKIASPALPNWTTIQLEDIARDTNAPVEDVFECFDLWLNFTRVNGWIDYVCSDLEPILKANWGDTERWHRSLGLIETRRAWEARGGGYANTVSDDGWKGFEEHLKLAEQSLTKAWQMNSNSAQTAYLMMRVELGQGRGLRRMETWFDRAMALNTNNYDAVSLMSFYLEPRWYGSEAQSLNFARSCVESEKWGGTVPLILPDLHHSLARYYKLSDSPEYWHRPEVWSDVKAGYEKFFELNPEAYGWRHDYAKDAFACGQYQVFLDQLPLFKFGTNYSFFGGKVAFDQMVAEATKAAGH